VDVICKKWTGVGFVKAGLGMTLGRQFSCIRQTKRRCKLSRLEWPRGQKFGLGLNHWPRNTVASAFGFWPSPWIQCPWITEVGRLTLAMESWLRLFCCQETSITLLRKPATLRLLPTHPQWRRHTTLIITGRDSGIWKALINRQNNSYQLRQFRPNSRIICLYWDFSFPQLLFDRVLTPAISAPVERVSLSQWTCHDITRSTLVQCCRLQVSFFQLNFNI